MSACIAAIVPEEGEPLSLAVREPPPTVTISAYEARWIAAAERAPRLEATDARSAAMGIIGWIVLGLIVGAVAKAVMPGEDGSGIVATMLLGVVGAFVGGLLGNSLFGVGIDQFWSVSTWVLAVIGAVIVLGVYRAIVGRRQVGG
ncbi:hypothetical protein GCM10009545_21320 [Saccharopolyspora thermophila]|uniref:GlsB/YeaQ/YmgE family stress response membrane protein n=1 Tax=Saccharopolyspora thermophila TaxID=89367 RepID=A0ABN1CH45_9PSEU